MYFMREMLLKFFFLPVLEYLSAVWCSAADSHLNLLDRAGRSVRFLSGGVFVCKLTHRRSVAVLCMLFKTCHRFTFLYSSGVGEPPMVLSIFFVVEEIPNFILFNHCRSSGTEATVIYIRSNI